MNLVKTVRNDISLYSHKNAHVNELSKGNCKQEPDPSTSLSGRKGPDGLRISRIWEHDVFQSPELHRGGQMRLTESVERKSSHTRKNPFAEKQYRNVTRYTVLLAFNRPTRRVAITLQGRLSRLSQ